MIKRLAYRFRDSSLRTKYFAAVILLLIATAISSSYLLSRNYKKKIPDTKRWNSAVHHQLNSTAWQWHRCVATAWRFAKATSA